MKKVIITGLCLTLGITISSAQVKLLLKPEANAKYMYQTEIVQHIKQSAMGQDIPIDEIVTMSLQMDVKSRNDMATESQFTWRNVSYQLSSPMLKMGYDSKKKSENPSPLDKMHEKIFGSILGKSFTLAIAPNGSVNRITGLDAITEGIKQSVSADGEMGAELSASNISQWLGEDAMKGMIEQTFRIFPADRVKPDDSWTIDSNYGVSNKKSKIKTVYTLKDIQKDVATVAVEATVEFDPGEGSEGVLKGTQTGILSVNTQTGIPLSSDLMLNIQGSVKSAMLNGGEMQIVVVAQIKTSIQEVK